MIRRSATTYNCNECDKVYYKKFEFYEHWNIHSKQTPFMCATCSQCFSLIEEYTNHYKSQHLLSKNSKVSKKKFGQSLEKSTNASKHLKPTKSTESKCKSRGNSGKTSTSHKSAKPKNLSESQSSENLDKVINKADNGESVFSKINLRKKKLPRIGNENSDVHKCQKCSKLFDKSEDFENHLKEHSRNSTKQYSSDEDISDDGGENDSAVKNDSHKSHKFHCEFCDFRFITEQRLKKHVCYIKPIFGENFKCSCLKEFTTSSDFKAHIGKKPYRCCLCSMMFLEFTNFIRHIRTHTNQKPYVCNLCGKQFSQSSNLENHSNTHLDYNAFKCDECKFSCKTLSGFTKHKKKHRSGLFDRENYVDGRKIRTVPKNISCPVCKRMFSFEKNMKAHLTSHYSVTSTLCIECGKMFESKHKLDNHFKACHENPSVCSFCGKVFASALLLYAHKRIHEKTNKLFSCDVCTKTFTMKNYLVQHMKTHSVEKKYLCQNCGKLFKVNASLKYHRKICFA